MEACAPVSAAVDVYGVGVVAAEVRGRHGLQRVGRRSRQFPTVLASL
jgi:hypothetical protein